MKRKNIIAAVSALLLALVLAGTAMAETVSPLPPQTDINNLADRFVTTDIEYTGNGKATLTLYENERFDADAIKAVKAGDVILSEGQAISVESVEWDGPDLYFNRGTDSEALFCENSQGTFEHVYHIEDDRIAQVKLGTMDQEILPYITMLDWVDAKTGESYEDKPAVRNGDELLKLLESNDGPSFSVNNVRILYDSNNKPVLIWRYYSPAQ